MVAGSYGGALRALSSAALILLFVTACGASSNGRSEVGDEVGTTPTDSEETPTPDSTPVDPDDAATITDAFSADPSEADVLWVVDSSGSMDAENDSLRAAIPSFLSTLGTRYSSVHMALTGSNVPVGASPLVTTPEVLTDALTDAETIAAWSAGLSVAGTTNSSLAGAKRALEYATAQPALGFLRPDADLFIIFASDDTDSSSQTTEFYATYFASLKPAGKLHISAFTEDPNAPCTRSNDTPEFFDLTSRLGGIIYNICPADLSPAFTTIATGVHAAVPPADLVLSNPPIDGTMSLKVDGVGTLPGPSTWSYDPTTHLISFAPGFLTTCREVDVSYQTTTIVPPNSAKTAAGCP